MDLTMSAIEKIKIDCISQLLSGKIDRELVRVTLGVSDETIRRYLRAYEKKGIEFFKHGNCGKIPKNKSDGAIKTKVLTIFQQKYFDCNVTHLKELLKEREGISIGYDTLRKWVKAIGLMKKAKRRSSKARYYRQRMSQRGFMIQMDGSPHCWFGNKKSCLIATIDDATSDVLSAEFFESEDTVNCMKVVRDLIRQYGKFKMLYVDRAGIFGGMKRQQFSQMKRACEELGINILYAPTPEAKGRVERLFQTLQDRLIVEMRLENIKNFSEANAFLQNQFIPHRWRGKFTVPPVNAESAFTPLLPSVDLDQIFCLKHLRTIARDHTIQWEGEHYALRASKDESIAGHLVEIREHITNSWSVYYRGSEIQLRHIRKGLSKLPWYRA